MLHACQVIHSGKLTEAIEVNCYWSKTRLPTIANDFPDCGRLDNATNNGQREERHKMDPHKKLHLEDLNFADDICLISYKLEDMQLKSNKLAEEASKIGLQVNIEKTEVMKIPGQQQQQCQTAISINGRNLKETTSFT